MSKTGKSVAVCPDCGEEVYLKGDIKLGMKTTCPFCHAKLEVVETVPLELDWSKQDEDYVYDEEDY